MVKEFRDAAVQKHNADKIDIKCEMYFRGRRERARNSKYVFSIHAHTQGHLCPWVSLIELNFGNGVIDNFASLLLLSNRSVFLHDMNNILDKISGRSFLPSLRRPLEYTFSIFAIPDASPSRGKS